MRFDLIPFDFVSIQFILADSNEVDSPLRVSKGSPPLFSTSNSVFGFKYNTVLWVLASMFATWLVWLLASLYAYAMLCVYMNGKYVDADVHIGTGYDSNDALSHSLRFGSFGYLNFLSCHRIIRMAHQPTSTPTPTYTTLINAQWKTKWTIFECPIWISVYLNCCICFRLVFND